jgi:hypothetical protein
MYAAIIFARFHGGAVPEPGDVRMGFNKRVEHGLERTIYEACGGAGAL